MMNLNNMDIDDIPAPTRLRNTIAKILGLPIERVTDELHYKSIPQWDSIAHVKILVELKRQTGIKIDPTHMNTLINVRDLLHVFLPDENYQRPETQTKPKEYNVNSSSPIYKGLENVVYDQTTISCIDTNGGQLSYRGIAISKLINHSFEEVMYLVLFGKMPNTGELAELRLKLTKHRNIDINDKELLQGFLQQSNSKSSELLQIGILAVTSSQISNLETCIEIIAKIPTIIGLINGNYHEDAQQSESYCQHLLHMLTGHHSQKDHIRLFEQVLIIQMEHESNASTFTARVATSTRADVKASIIAAISTFSGELHGGALERAHAMLGDLCFSNQPVDEFIENRFKQKQPIYGFGHRVYKISDPRSILLEGLCKTVEEKIGCSQLLSNAKELRIKMAEYVRSGLVVNVDFFASCVLDSLGIPNHMLLPTFIATRTCGWSAHLLEQVESSTLIRPRLIYVARNTVSEEHSKTEELHLGKI